MSSKYVVCVLCLLLGNSPVFCADEKTGLGALAGLFFGTSSTSVAEFGSVPMLVANTLANGKVVQALPVFDDQWLFSDGQRIALSDEGIFQKSNPQATWEPVYETQGDSHAVSLHFDELSERGVAYFWSSTLVTINGGASWNQINTDAIVERVFGDNDHLTSGVHLHPVTGYGSFTSNCTFFETRDFAATWYTTALKFASEAENKKACLSLNPFALDLSAGLALAGDFREDYVLERPQNDASTLADWKPLCRTGGWVPEVRVDYCGDMVLTGEQERFIEKAGRRWPVSLSSLPIEAVDKLMSGEPLREPFLAAVRDNGVHQWVAGKGFLAIADSKGLFAFEYRLPALDEIYPLTDKTALGVAAHQVYVTNDGGVIWRLISIDGKRSGVFKQNRKNGSVLFYDGSDTVQWKGKEVVSFSSLMKEIEDIDLWLTSASNRNMWVLPYESHYYWLSKDFGENWKKYLAPFPPDRVDQDGDASTPWPVSFDCTVTEVEFDCAAVYEDGNLLRWQAESPATYQLVPTPDLVTTEEFFRGEHIIHGMVEMMGNKPLVLYFSNEFDHLFVLEGNQWKRRKIQRAYSAEHADARDHPELLLEVVDTNEVVTINATGQQKYFRFRDMSTINRHCTNDQGVIILIDADNRVALTTDGGTSWSAATKYNRNRKVTCGIFQRWVWMLEDRLTIVDTQSR